MISSPDFARLKSTGLLPSPKGVIASVIRLCEKEATSLQELAQAIQADPALAGRIIRLANASQSYRARSVAAVTSDVLILVGVQAVRQIALSLSLMNANRSGLCDGFNYTHFWQRSLCMACAAQAVGLHVKVAPLAEVFTAGLLAGIGRLGFASACPSTYGPLLQRMAHDAGLNLRKHERDLYGFDHLQLTAWMMLDWRIPALFADAVLHHEAPHAGGFAPASRQLRLAQLLCLASHIADAATGNSDLDIAASPAVTAAAQTIELDDERLQQIVAECMREWHDWRGVLGLPASHGVKA
jgi:HD-like signal output (HDOD) protein